MNIKTKENLEVEEISKRVGEKIQYFREKRHYEIREMAAHLDLEETYLQNIEEGKVEISLEELIQIANYLDLPMDCFLSDFLHNKSKAYYNDFYQLLFVEASEEERKNFQKILDKTMELLLLPYRDISKGN